MKAVKDGEININGGDQWRPIIAVKDIAGYVTEACREEYEGIYVLSLENVIIRELGEKISNLIPNTKVNYTEISFQDARNYKVDNAKSLKTFKYKPTVTVEDEVARMVTLFKENRVENPEDKVYHNGAFLTNKKENNLFI
jgi:nucleoside-diphosphate-sugar epimerase